MAQRRMLSRRISQSKKVNALSLKAQIVWTWTHPFLDDYGRYTADPEDIKTEVFPKNGKISVKDIENSLLESAGKELITLYRVEGKAYQEYGKFEDHQTFRADRERKAEYPGVDKGIPMTTNDIPKLSKDKLSKDKLSKDNKEQPEAAKLLDKVYKKGLNIYALMNKLKKQLGWKEELQFPEEVLVKVCNDYLSLKPGIVIQPWSWFTCVIKAETAAYFAKKSIEEGEKWKKQPAAISIKDILAKMK